MQYLQEMGIPVWTLAHAGRLAGYQPAPVDLPASCRLLLVAPTKPAGNDALLFERVLHSIHLNLQDALHVEPNVFPLLGQHQLEWVWFSGCEKQAADNIKTLTSPLLSAIDGNKPARRALWQQICAYN